MTHLASNDALLRIADVLKIIPVSKTEWYRGIKRGIYPPPIKVGKKLALWRASSIQQLIASLQSAAVAEGTARMTTAGGLNAAEARF